MKKEDEDDDPKEKKGVGEPSFAVRQRAFKKEAIEEQAKLPIVNPIEMGFANGDAAVQAIATDAEYVAMFQAAYDRPPNYDDVGRAIASFERTFVFLDALPMAGRGVCYTQGLSLRIAQPS